MWSARDERERASGIEKRGDDKGRHDTCASRGLADGGTDDANRGPRGERGEPKEGRLRRGTIGSPLFVFGDLSPARGTKKRAAFLPLFFSPSGRDPRLCRQV